MRNHHSGRRARAAGRAWLRSVALLALALPMAGGAEASTFSVLTYNVAGLPLGLSGSSPEVNSVQISPRLNPFDLVAVQEDFGFHEDLTSQVTHPFQSVKDTTDVQATIDFAAAVGQPAPQLGDGLNTFSSLPFTDLTRVTWNDCFGIVDNGSDCLAPKGFTFARHEAEPGVFVDVYNLHADASEDPGSVAARRSNLRQLADFVVATSERNAVIVLGDTNSRYTRDDDILPEFLETLGLSDVWVELSRGGVIPEVGDSLRECDADLAGADCERVDKIFYRSGDDVQLSALSHTVFGDWVDADGVQLSDHWPVSAEFEVRGVPEPATGLLLAGALAWLAAIRRRGEVAAGGTRSL